MISKLARQPPFDAALTAAATLGCLGFIATIAVIRALRRALAERYDDGRIAGYIAGAEDHERTYLRALPRDRAE